MTLGFEGIAALLGLYILWAWLYRQYRIDKTRAMLFAQRHRLFLLAADGRIDFNAPAYREAERLLNALIRQTHQMTLVRFLVMRPFLDHAEQRDEASRIHDAVESHPDETVRDELREILTAAGAISLAQLAMSFLLTWTLFQVAYHIAATRRWLENSGPQRFSRQIRRLEDEALVG
ncbi:hypothetical protein [Arhodomonas sp. SL1]|uniref:hypothetical protein n=1 Tax=Arhodomonas sp. SL1 TaxID=3425691 RepID=UPI003F880642